MNRAEDLKQDFISTDFKIAMNDEGVFFRIGDKIHHEGAPENEIGIIESFSIDSESEEVLVQTNMGSCHLAFIYHIEEETKEFECTECGKPMETDKTYCSDACFKASQL